MGDTAKLPDPRPSDRERSGSTGVVVTLYSGLCRVDDGRRLVRCVLPSRLAQEQQSSVAVGDEVRFERHGRDHRICEVLPRRTVLSRPDPHNPRRERVIAANIDVVVQVSSVVRPPLRPALIDRTLIAVERGGARAVVAVNKIDLVGREELAAELEPLAAYRTAGVAIVPCSARSGVGLEELEAQLGAATAVFVGHSGVGKSSLLNALAPDTAAATGELAAGSARGRHTTTRSRLYRLAGGARVIDTPGIRALGLWGLEPRQLAFYFPDFDDIARGCHFSNCTHSHEPDCAVRAADAEGRLPPGRYATYARILESLVEEARAGSP